MWSCAYVALAHAHTPAYATYFRNTSHHTQTCLSLCTKISIMPSQYTQTCTSPYKSPYKSLTHGSPYISHTYVSRTSDLYISHIHLPIHLTICISDKYLAIHLSPHAYMCRPPQGRRAGAREEEGSRARMAPERAGAWCLTAQARVEQT